MTTLIIAKLNPKDADKVGEYSKRAAPTVAAFGGEFLSKGSLSPLHGDSKFAKAAIISFPSREGALGWYQSKAYQDLIVLRDEAMDCQFLIVE